MNPQQYQMIPIARIENDYKDKFGIPRQSGMTGAVSKIVFEPDFRIADAIRGIEEFSHLWLLWIFSENTEKGWHPTVRPPRLGGNERRGVFATRSPFRPNFIGMTCVRLESIEYEKDKGYVLLVSGADLLSETPIIDIKPYVSMDRVSDARCGFSEENAGYRLAVVVPDPSVLEDIPADKRPVLLETLALDPRPSYHDDPERIYGFRFAGFEVKFRVEGGVLTLLSCEEI